MLDRPLYPGPGSRPLRWLAEIGPGVPEEVQQRLRAAFFVSRAPLVIGGLNTVTVAMVAYFRMGQDVFAAVAAFDLVLLALRIVLLRRVSAPSGPIFATGLLWACLQATTIALIVASSDVAMSLIVLASGLAATGGITGRNFAAPRYAMAQVLVIDLSYKITFSIHHMEFLPLIVLQTVMFAYMTSSIMKQARQAAIQAITGEIENRHQSITDPLTGLLNRRGLSACFEAMTSAVEDRTLFYLDLDGFKEVNDRFGHASGDELLCEVGRRLRGTVGPGGVACRLGGDEFLVLADGLDAPHRHDLGAAIIAAVAQPCPIGHGVLARVGVSIGTVRGSPDTPHLAEMMMRADRALYAAKGGGKGCCVTFEDLGKGSIGRAA